MRPTRLILLILLAGDACYSQESDGYGINRPRYYSKHLHLGFAIGFSQADLRINPKPNSAFPDTLLNDSRYRMKTIYTVPSPGFAIGPVCDLRLAEYFRLRFTPAVSLNPRRLEYTLATNDRDSSKIYQKTVESVFLIFPLELKIQSKRLGNFGAYVIGGGGHTLDLSARKAAGSAAAGANQIEDNVRLKRDDLYYSTGAGTDFYLEYFKLGFELKLLIGTRNLLKPQGNIFSTSIDKVRSRMVVFSVTFEG